MVRTSVSVCVILLLICGVVPAWAQVPAANTITCSSGTACKKGNIPVFASSGGAATVDDSIIKQSGSTISVAGSETVTTNISAGGNVSATGNVSGGSVSTTGNISAANVSATGNVSGGGVSTTGNISGANVSATGSVSSATVSASSNINAGGNVTATGSVSGGSVSTTGNVSGATVSASSNISAGGNVTATGSVSGATVGASSNISAGGNVTATGNVSGANVSASSDISASGNVTGEVVNATTGFDLGGAPFAFGNGGNGNAFLGFAGNSTTTGTDNTAAGAGALQANTSGSGIVAYGQAALVSNTTGSDNAAFGADALEENTSGYENTGIGVDALEFNTTGFDLTCIGFDCTASKHVHNATAIGARAMVKVSNALVLGSVAGVNGAKATTKVGIGTTSPTNLLTLGQGAGPSIADGWTTYSSRRWKTNIHLLQNALSKVEQLRGVSYDLKDSGKHEIGVIAEEVGAVVPELVTYEDNGRDARGVDYSRLTALLIEATKEQQALIHQQQQQIRGQQVQMKAQEAQIAQLSSQVKAIQVSLKASGRTGAEVLRTVKAQAPLVQQ